MKGKKKFKKKKFEIKIKCLESKHLLFLILIISIHQIVSVKTTTKTSGKTEAAKNISVTNRAGTLIIRYR